MKRSFLVLLLLVGWENAVSAADDLATSPTLQLPAAGEAREITEEQYKMLISSHQHDLLVVNFWATWCVPCVQEIPHFVEASQKFEDREVLVVGVSLDFLDERESRVEPFLLKHKIPYPNYVLNADQNAFLKNFPSEWTGALPATFLYDRKGNLLGYALQAVSNEELEKLIQKNLPPPTP